MKRMSALIVMVLCLSLLTAASAEGSLKRGYEAVERKTFMFEQLSEIHFGPESVVEYDAEHFAVFTDPETGYWGVGLKAEYYPVNEGDIHTFENPAVIVLNDIGFDNNYHTNYDIRISIDRVTYASLDGTTVKEGADVLGIFGYSRGMETVGFLSGWGCRVLAQDGEVWQVEDAAAYDTFGLCTEAEISVTAVSKDGRELKPGMLGGIKWTVADLDTLQPEGSAAGYDAHYFDETLKLVEGLVYSYAVQENHVLKTRGEERVNDCIVGKGELTGREEGELAKRLASVIVSQDVLTAKAVWRGCGNENAPARTELVFVGGPNDKTSEPAEPEEPVVPEEPEEPVAPTTVAYTVQYINRTTGKSIWPDKYVTDVEPGTHVIEYPEQVLGYKAMQPKYEWDVVGNEVKIFIYYEYEEPICN